MLHWCSPANHVGFSSRRLAFKSQMEHQIAATDGIEEPSCLESNFLKGIPSLNLGRGVNVNDNHQTFISVWNNVFTRAFSLVRLKRFAHNKLIAGSNPARPIGRMAYNLLCGVGSASVGTTGERNLCVPSSLRLRGVAQRQMQSTVDRKYAGSNPAAPIEKLAYRMLCGVGSTRDATSERNAYVPTSLRRAIRAWDWFMHSTCNGEFACSNRAGGLSRERNSVEAT